MIMRTALVLASATLVLLNGECRTASAQEALDPPKVKRRVEANRARIINVGAQAEVEKLQTAIQSARTAFETLHVLVRFDDEYTGLEKTAAELCSKLSALQPAVELRAKDVAAYAAAAERANQSPD